MNSQPTELSGVSTVGPRRYAEAVPAVVRALDVLACLRATPDGLTLSRMSRLLVVSPSSLLAILRTLQGRGHLTRDELGRYRLGPALAELTDRAAGDPGVREVAAAVAALARAAALAPPSGEETRAGRAAMLRALGLAAGDLSAALLGAAAPDGPTPERPDPVRWADASGPLGRVELDQFLGGGWLATLSCLKENGYPYSVPVWYQWEQDRFWVVPRARAEWARYLERDPRVSLTIGEPTPPLRRVLVEGRAEEITGPRGAQRGLELASRMARRYLGERAPSYVEAAADRPQRVFAIAPERLVTWRGLAPHPRYAAGERRGAGGEGVA